jgi:endonuclease/exonuclease/phosphatase (EEP) superfamily protein YafD
MAFTPYVAATAPVPVLIALVLRRWAVAGVATAALLALGVAVLPRAVGHGDARASDDDRGPRLVVMTANLHREEADAHAVMRLVREHQVDLLALQELTPEALWALDAAGARRVLPGRAVEELTGAAGSGLMARRPLRRVDPPDPDGGAAQPEAAFTVPGTVALRAKTVHPYPPTSSWAAAAWRRELRALPGPRDGDALRIIAGDFNGTLDHREMQRLLDLGYVDAAAVTGNGLRGTYPAGRRRPPQIAIDHVLVPPGVKVRWTSVRVVPGSDHRAVIAELVLPER